VSGDVVLRAWAAGLFEGEGSFSMDRGRKGYTGLHATLASTDEDVVRTFHRIVAVGTVTGPHSRAKAHWKPLWRWETKGVNVERVYHLLEPWLHSRRRARFAELLIERRAYEQRLPEILSAKARAGALLRWNRHRAWQKERLF
jgi:hypothetical protein